jgi:hypothetical protein
VKNSATLFVPMFPCLSSLNTRVQSGLAKPTVIMAFNECNHPNQCLMSADSAAKSMGAIMSAYPNARLVSPSTAGDGEGWYSAFFAACRARYGTGGCRISAIAAHAYSCRPERTMAYLKKLHDTFGLPIFCLSLAAKHGALAARRRTRWPSCASLCPCSRPRRLLSATSG